MSTASHAAGVEHYIEDYMTKDKEKGLERATSTMLAALNYVEENKSKAEDVDFDEMRNSKFLAARTINSFQGGIEHEVRTMIAALLGMKSEICSDKYHYIFPFDLIRFLKKCEENNMYCPFNIDVDDSNDEKPAKNKDFDINKEISEIVNHIEKDEEQSNIKEEIISGTKIYKIDENNCVLL